MGRKMMDEAMAKFLEEADKKDERFKGWKRQVKGVLEIYTHPKTGEKMVSRVGGIVVYPDSPVNRSILSDPDYPYSLGG